MVRRALVEPLLVMDNAKRISLATIAMLYASWWESCVDVTDWEGGESCDFHKHNPTFECSLARKDSVWMDTPKDFHILLESS